MKHMTAAPDLTNIEEPFARVIRKALAKDPAERYQSVQEMVEDVFGTEHVRNSVSQFAPEELSVVAEHIAQKMQGAQAQAAGQTPAPARRRQGLQQGDRQEGREVRQEGGGVRQESRGLGNQWRRSSRPPRSGRSRCGTVPGRRSAQSPPAAQAGLDRHGRRRPWGRVSSAVMAREALLPDGGGRRRHDRHGLADHPAGPPAVVARPRSRIRRGWGKVGTCFLAAFVATLVGTVIGGVLGVAPIDCRAAATSWPMPMPPFMPMPFRGFWFGNVLALALPMLLVDWWKLTDPQRPRRVVVGHAIGVGFLGFIAGGIFGLNPVIAACTLAGIVLVVQTLSPWGQILATMPGGGRRLRVAAARAPSLAMVQRVARQAIPRLRLRAPPGEQARGRPGVTARFRALFMPCGSSAGWSAWAWA